MGTMTDAVDQARIPVELNGKPALRITVLADPAGEAFDFETENAGAVAVSVAMRQRLGAGKWSLGYVNESQFPELEAAMGPRELRFSDASEWPAPGVYLWAADPDGNIAAGRWKPPVTPIAVQDRWNGTTDQSTTVDPFPFAVAGYIDGKVSQWPANAWERFTDATGVPLGPSAVPVKPAPAPAPTPGSKGVNVQLPILQNGSQGPSVRSVQTLVGGVAADGIFGPRTHDAVVAFQSREKLTTDGIVGLHTWGALLGSPQ